MLNNGVTMNITANCFDPLQAVKKIVSIVAVEKAKVAEDNAKALLDSQNVEYTELPGGLLIVAGMNGPIEFRSRSGEYRSGGGKFYKGGVFSVLKLCEVGV